MTDISAVFLEGTTDLTDEQVSADLLEIMAQIRQASAEGRLLAVGIVLGVSPRDGSCDLIANSCLIVDSRVTSEGLGGLVEKADEIVEMLEEVAAGSDEPGSSGPRH